MRVLGVSGTQKQVVGRLLEKASPYLLSIMVSVEGVDVPCAWLFFFSVQVVSLASTLAIGALCGLAAGVLGFFLGRKVATTPSVGFQLLPKSTW